MIKINVHDAYLRMYNSIILINNKTVTLSANTVAEVT